MAIWKKYVGKGHWTSFRTMPNRSVIVTMESAYDSMLWQRDNELSTMSSFCKQLICCNVAGVPPAFAIENVSDNADGIHNAVDNAVPDVDGILFLITTRLLHLMILLLLILQLNWWWCHPLMMISLMIISHIWWISSSICCCISWCFWRQWCHWSSSDS